MYLLEFSTEVRLGGASMESKYQLMNFPRSRKKNEEPLLGGLQRRFASDADDACSLEDAANRWRNCIESTRGGLIRVLIADDLAKVSQLCHCRRRL